MYLLTVKWIIYCLLLEKETTCGPEKLLNPKKQPHHLRAYPFSPLFRRFFSFFFGILRRSRMLHRRVHAAQKKLSRRPNSFLPSFDFQKKNFVGREKFFRHFTRVEHFLHLLNNSFLSRHNSDTSNSVNEIVNIFLFSSPYPPWPPFFAILRVKNHVWGCTWEVYWFANCERPWGRSRAAMRRLPNNGPHLCPKTWNYEVAIYGNF